jgi:hypothetical protein
MKSLKDFIRTEIQEGGSPDTDGDGLLSPSELHQHLDIQKRGKVDLGDYAAHIMFHAHHPEYLAHVVPTFNDVQRRHAEGQEMCEHDPVMKKLKSNAALVATDYPIYEGREATHTEEDPPAMLVMRRKSIRLFPNGQKVALYYIDKLNKYVSIPYSGIMTVVPEETVFDRVKNVKETKQSVVVEHLDGTTSEVTPQVAHSIMNLYKKINETNREKLADMLEASAKHFQTIVKFSKE